MSYTLYHFTSDQAVPGIWQSGINPSWLAIPGGGTSTAQVVSLTANSDPADLIYKSLWDHSPLNGGVLQQYMFHNPTAVPPIYVPATCAIRLTLAIPENDVNLYELAYPAVEALGFTSQAVIDSFLSEGGGTAGHWFVYCGILPAAYIRAVERL
jgi:hypothetical protein